LSQVVARWGVQIGVLWRQLSLTRFMQTAGGFDLISTFSKKNFVEEMTGYVLVG